MRVARTRRWLRRHTRRFETVVESRALIWPRSVSGTTSGRAYHGAVPCPRSGSVRPLDDCVHCPHFVNLRPDASRHSAALRCLSSDDDPIACHLMCEPRWYQVEPETPVATARLISWLNRIPFLLVCVGATVIGVVHAGELQHREGAVADVMIPDPWSLSPAATLGDALEAMDELRVPGLLIVDPESELRSVVCSNDLSRLGVLTAWRAHQMP